MLKTRGKMIQDMAGAIATTLIDLAGAIIGPGRKEGAPADDGAPGTATISKKSSLRLLETSERTGETPDDPIQRLLENEPSGEPEEARSEPGEEILQPNGHHTPRFFQDRIMTSLHSNQGRERVKSIQDRIEVEMEGRFTPQDLAIVKDGIPRWKVSIHICARIMRKQGLLRKDSPQGTWELTQKGTDEPGTSQDILVETPGPVSETERHPPSFYMETLLRRFRENDGVLESTLTIREMGAELDDEINWKDRMVTDGSIPAWWKNIRRCRDALGRARMLRTDSTMGVWELNEKGRAHVGLQGRQDPEFSAPAEGNHGPEPAAPAQGNQNQEPAAPAQGNHDDQEPAATATQQPPFVPPPAKKPEEIHTMAFYRGEILAYMKENGGVGDNWGMRTHILTTLSGQFSEEDWEKTPEGICKWERQVAHCRYDLSRKGLIKKDVVPKKWRITDAGRKLAARPDDGIPESRN